MEAFAALRATAAEPTKARAAAPEKDEVLAAANVFNLLIGSLKEAAAGAGAEDTEARETAAKDKVAPRGAGAQPDGDTSKTEDSVAEPPAIAPVAAELQRLPVALETALLRIEAVAEDADSQHPSPSALDGGAVPVTPAALAAPAGDAPDAGTLRTPTIAAAPAPAPRPAQTGKAAPPPDRAPIAGESAGAASEPPPRAPKAQSGAGGLEAAAPESANSRNGAEAPPPAAEPIAAERTPAETARPEKAPPPQAAPLAIESAAVNEIAPLPSKVQPAEGPAPFLAATPAEAAHAAKAPPFEVATITRRSDGGLEIRLDPPDLGAVSIQFFEDDGGALLAAITTERGETLDILRRHSDFLQRELARQGAGDFTLSFSDRRDSGAQAQDNGTRERRTFRFGETPEAFVRNIAGQSIVRPTDRVDLIA